jgi:5'-nucleotidase / UDP-sugar diphosphatase
MSRTLKSLILGAATFAALGSVALAQQVKVSLLVVADIYEMKVDDVRGGFSRAAAVARQARAAGGNFVYVLAGDAISPSLFSGFDKGEHVIDLLNMEPPDIFVPGNHEFDFGPDLFRTRMADLKSEKLAANLRDANGDILDGFADTMMYEFDGVKLGFIGLTEENSVAKSSPGDLQISGAVAAFVTQAAALREAGADLIVVVTHSSAAMDRELVASGLADVILSGDDHDLGVFYNGVTAVGEPSSDAAQLVTVDLTIDVKDDGERRKVKWWPTFNIIDTENITPPDDYVTKVAALTAQLDQELDVVVGTTATPLDSRKASVRTMETSFGNLVTDGMRAAVGADVAITNGGGIRANREYDAGYAITRKDILTELPFGNLTIKVEVSGADILAMLENGLGSYPDATGRFPQVSGMNVVFDPAQDAGSRVVSVEIGGAPLDPGATYTLATNDFMGRGGDGYTMLVGKPNLIDVLAAKLMAADVLSYISEQGTVSPAIEGRMVAMR